MKPLSRKIWFSKYTLLAIAALLFLLSFIFNKQYINRSAVADEAHLAEQYLKKTSDDFDGFLADTSRINRLLKQTEKLDEFKKIAEKNYCIFLYSVNEFGTTQLRFWNSQLVSPTAKLLAENDGEYFTTELNGKYYVIRKTIRDTANNPLLAVAMIPVRSRFFITTDYLPETFFYSRTADKRVKISDNITSFPVKTKIGKVLFYLDKKVSVAVAYNDRRTIILRFIGLLALCCFVHLLAESVARKNKTWRAIGLLSVILLVLRLITYYYPGVLNLRQFELFNPVIYGSNAIQRSLGDLLINSILFCWVVLFAWSKLRYVENPVAIFSQKIKWIAGVSALGMLIFSTFILATVIRSMVADSKISFDVTNFFSLTQYTVVGFFVLACLSLSYYYLSQLLFRLIFPLFDGKNYLIYFAIGLAGLIYLTTRSGKPEVLFYLPVLAWLTVYTWLVNRKGVIFNRIRINIAGILSWIFVFSVSITIIMFSQNRQVEWEKRKLIAEKLAVQADPSSERLMNIGIKYIDNDFLSDNFYRFTDEAKSQFLRDSLIRNNFSGYLNKYDTKMYAYDSSNNPLNNEDALSYESLNTIVTVEAKTTETEGLYYYGISFDRFSYISKLEVIDTVNHFKQGTFFIVSSLKSYSRDALFPELFRQFKDIEPEDLPIYTNAVYDSGQLVSPEGNYPFPIWLTKSEVPKEEFSRRKNNEYDELWYNPGNYKVVIIARKKQATIETITLFSYIFCSFLFLVAFVQLISFILRTGYNWGGLRKLFQLNIRSQVHSTIIFISIFSFVVIGASTIQFFITRNKQSNGDKLSRTMNIMVNEMQKRLVEHNTFDDVVKIYDSVSNTGLQKLVDDVSDIHGIDVNVYDTEGDLRVSSEANVYTKGVLSKKMNPVAFYHLDRLRHVQYVTEEKIGNFSYLSLYSPVRDDHGKVEAYINIPYFTSKPELRQEISNFLVAIINLNAFIFLIAGLIALFITNRITNSFSIISDKMKEINLGQHNDEIVWNRNDEIGELVQEYNKMVAKLGESASALAKSEREGAWREMARQVAHEIKNPLTPMKLSIQYLQKAINNNQPNVKELSGTVANTLVEQIDHLSKIAADFSQFANISSTNAEVFDLHTVISSLKQLYASNQNVQITWRPVQDKVMIQADKTQMNRLFTNLLTNAVEARQEDTICKIDIDETRENDMIIISIKDNGEGIPPETQARIFTPNFTTKSSGTGLGLAMCKGIVEQAKGKISFETEQGKGTTFHVTLPVRES